MKQAGGVWLPDHEEHLIAWMNNAKNKRLVDGKITYQYVKFQKAMALVKRFGVVVDVGAHCGLWSMHFAKQFETIHAFEPVAEHRECFVKNVPMDTKCVVNLYAVALGEKEGAVRIEVPRGSSGGSHVAGAGEIPMKRLDDYALPQVDLLKIDTEGFELFVLRGAEETLKRCRPAIIVEQKPGRAESFGLPRTQGVDYLQGLGAELREHYSGDYFLSWT